MGGEHSTGDGGTRAAVELPKGQIRSTQAQDETLLRSLEDAKKTDDEELIYGAAIPAEPLPYDPRDSKGLELIESSAFAMNQSERALFEKNGFVISSRQVFPHFSYGYASIYSSDLPLYVSADSLLHAVHRSYEDILEIFEVESVAPALVAYLEGTRKSLASAELDPRSLRDLDIFLSVALELAVGKEVVPFDSANGDTVSELVAAATAATGHSEVELFGSSRDVDFSQFEPRGHYTDQGLDLYFRSMMWLGRIDFRLVEYEGDKAKLQRPQLKALLALDEIMTSALRRAHADIDNFVTAFVGEHDAMTLSEVAQLKVELGIGESSELDALSDTKVLQVLDEGAFGKQRISSHIVQVGLSEMTQPLAVSFALFGQRYTLDSHVFSNVVYDRAGGGTVARMMPNPLDVAYAALGNDHAAALLSTELETYDYAPDLQAMRVIADWEGDKFWGSSLYNRWLYSLRALSPQAAGSSGSDENSFPLDHTDAWNRRILNTQLASWAELRHDTVLSVKQSYTGAASCEFPDAYVDPYPEFFARLEDYALHALSLLDSVNFEVPDVASEHFELLATVSRNLREMAEHQRTGAPHSAENMAFINDAVSLGGICATTFATGWYGKLFLNTRSSGVTWAPTIVDVHTQPTDEVGHDVGKVLHVGTGDVRLITVSVDSCSGPRAYVGLVSSYCEHVEGGYGRLTDEDWEQRLRDKERPPAPQWLNPILAE